jgi:hypothetical protein
MPEACSTNRDWAFPQSEAFPKVVTLAKINMVVLPCQLFYSVQIPVRLSFLAKSKNDGKRRVRRKHTLFIDARKLGSFIDLVLRELTTVNSGGHFVADVYSGTASIDFDFHLN